MTLRCVCWKELSGRIFPSRLLKQGDLLSASVFLQNAEVCFAVYPPPAAIETEVFWEVPKRLQVVGRSSEWVDVQRFGAPTTSFLEGPSFDRAGNLYVVDIPYGRIFRVAPDGTFTVVVEYDGEPNGLKIHKDGRIFIADYKNGIMQLDPDKGEVKPYFDRPVLERFKGVNDLVFASNGDMYFTDQGQTGWQDPTGRVYCLRADGRFEKILDGIPSPNGLVLSLDEKLLYVAVTRANAIWRAPLLKTGASKVGTFIQLSGGGGPDGLAIDEDGGLVVAHVGLGSVWIFNRLGEPAYRLKSPRGHLTTNVAYGGPDRRTLYITESETGSILRAKVPVAGSVMYSHM